MTDPTPVLAVDPARAAGMLGVTVKKLKGLGIPCVRMGHRTVRYRVADLEAYLEGKAA